LRMRVRGASSSAYDSLASESLSVPRFSPRPSCTLTLTQGPVLMPIRTTAGFMLCGVRTCQLEAVMLTEGFWKAETCMDACIYHQTFVSVYGTLTSIYSPCSSHHPPLHTHLPGEHKHVLGKLLKEDSSGGIGGTFCKLCVKLLISLLQYSTLLAETTHRSCRRKSDVIRLHATRVIPRKPSSTHA
jgi:hypothetical protein